MGKKAKSERARLAEEILAAYQPETVAEMQEALKDIFGPMFEAMLQGEMNAHLGYGRHERGVKENENRRNGYSEKALKTTAGEVKIEVPRDRDGSFSPRIVQKRQKDDIYGVLLRLVIFPQRHIQAVYEQERIQLLQRPVLPLLQLFQHAVCDVGDHFVGNLKSIDILNRLRDIPLA